MAEQQTKTVIEWLEQAKADGYGWAQSAIEQCKNPKHLVMELSDAILYGLTWQATKEGADYWDRTHEKLCEKGL